MMHRHRSSARPLLLSVIAATLAGGLAQAEPTKAMTPITLAVFATGEAPRPQPISPAMTAYAQLLKQRMNGVAQTSIASRFDDKSVGEAGFLCGLQPHPDTSGAAAAFGHDPDGRFVGAKLRVAF